MFHDVQFPTGISYGSRGGPGFSTNIIETDSGAEQRVQRWSQPKHMYDVAWGVKTLDDLATVRNFYIARSGCAYAFRYKDWMDFSSSANGMGAVVNTDQQIGTGTGAQTTFQLVKKYTNGPSTVTRTITKPVADTTVIALNGVNQASGWAVNTSTGVVTFTAAPGAGVVVTAGFQFDVPVRFGKEIDQQLAQQIDGFDNGNIQSIPLVELMDTSQVDEDYPYGGTFNLSSGANLTINLLKGRTQAINMTGAGLSATLPDPATLPLGGPIVTIINAGANTFAVKTHLAATLLNLAAGQAAIIYLGVDSGGTLVWYAV